MNFIWDSMWLFLWVIFLPTYLDGLFYYSPNSANYSCSRLLNKTRGIFLASVFPFLPSQPWDIVFFFFDIRKSSILADFIRISNNFLEITACCKSLISVQTILWTRDFPLWNSLLISHLYLIRYFIFISSSDPKSRNQSIGIK